MLSVARQSLLCSFCRKPQSEVQKLIASPSDGSRAYICDECIAACANIVKEEAASATEPEQPPIIEEGHPLLEHARASELFAVLEIWIKRESLGEDAAEELGQVRAIASEMLREA